MRRSIGGAVITVLCLLWPGPALAFAPTQATVSLAVSVGWNGSYRAGGSWSPVRVTAHNSSDGTVDGTLEIPDRSISAAVGLQQPAIARYRAPIVLAPNSTKTVSLYIPGADIQGEVDVSLTVGGAVIAVQREFPSPFQDRDVTVGAFTADPTSVSWVNETHIPHARIRLFDLSSNTFDPYPAVLSSLDVILISDVDASTLDADQTAALTQYVEQGGALLLVGGPA